MRIHYSYSDWASVDLKTILTDCLRKIVDPLYSLVTMLVSNGLSMLLLRQLPPTASFMASKYVNMQHIETLVVQHFKTKSARLIRMIDGVKGLSSSTRIRHIFLFSPELPFL